MSREIVLDTETTGFDPRTGDRMIEVGCIEIEDLLPTGRTFHRLINPERLIPADAIRVHGITDDKVKDATPRSSPTMPSSTAISSITSSAAAAGRCSPRIAGSTR
jgi:DNA polymerase III epsilon subunit-like protein